MKTSLVTEHDRAMTLIEVLVVLAVLMVLVALLIPRLKRARATGDRIQCDNNLKQIGLAYRVWSGDNHGNFPMAVSQTNGGTMELITGPNAWRHYQVMSNELSTPWVLTCPAETDQNHLLATTFDAPDAKHKVQFLSNSNLSFFVSIVSNDINPQMILSGDRNITNGTTAKKGLLELTTNNPAGWTAEMHKGVGNFALADGSVQQISTVGLRTAVENTGLATNRLQMP